MRFQQITERFTAESTFTSSSITASATTWSFADEVVHEGCLPLQWRAFHCIFSTMSQCIECNEISLPLMHFDGPCSELLYSFCGLICFSTCNNWLQWQKKQWQATHDCQVKEQRYGRNFKVGFFEEGERCSSWWQIKDIYRHRTLLSWRLTIVSSQVPQPTCFPKSGGDPF